MSEPSHSDKRPLTLLAAIALVVANMIGTGIFTSTGFMAAGVTGGWPILIGWVLGGVIALCGAAVYGELGAMMPRAGGEYVYLKEAFHPSVGFMSAWVSLIVGFSAPIAAAGNAFGGYLSKSVDVHPTTAGVILILALTGLHIASVVIGARVQTVFSILKVVLIMFFIVAGVAVGEGDWGNISSGSGIEATTTGAFAVSLVYISFSYSGWNAAAYVAGEIQNPGRNVPLALFVGTALVTLLYIGLNLIFLYAQTPADMAGVKEVGDLTARNLFGSSTGKLLSLLIAIALVSSVSAMVMAGPRVYMAMSQDGLFFKLFGKKTAGGSPIYSILLQGVIAIILLLSASFDQLVNYIGFTLAIFATLTVISAYVLRVKRPDADRPYRTFGWPVTPIIFIGFNLWMIYFLVQIRPTESAWGLITVAVGGVVYVGFWLHGRLTALESRVSEIEQELGDDAAKPPQ